MIKDTTRVEPEFESLTDDDTEAKSIATTTDVSAHSKFASLETDTIIPNIIKKYSKIILCNCQIHIRMKLFIIHTRRHTLTLTMSIRKVKAKQTSTQ